MNSPQRLLPVSLKEFLCFPCGFAVKVFVKGRQITAWQYLQRWHGKIQCNERQKGCG
jgi:hypothetical protein